MNAWSDKSWYQLQTCDPKLILLFNSVLLVRDCSILEGHRDEERQQKMVAEGKSKLDWPKSRHNSFPSMAVDCVPYPVPDWDESEPFIRFAHFVLGVAHQQGVLLTWGGDWDSDWDLKDNRFNDYPHFELRR